MIECLQALIRTDFMQGMLTASLTFLLPLHKKPDWKRRFLGVTAVSLLVSFVLTVLAVAWGWTIWTKIPYFAAPLAASLTVFLLCSEGGAPDGCYGMGCAYAA